MFLVEARKYRMTGHRLSRDVDRFYTVPAPKSPGYAAALLDIVLAESVDVYVPVCSPVSSYDDALVKPLLEPHAWCCMQQFLTGQEYCVHTTLRDGAVQVYACCASSAFQVNYEMVDSPAIEAWVRGFVEPLKLTGQIGFDVIQTGDGRVYPIECNPRAHSAITLFYDHPDLARAYVEDDVAVLTPTPSSRPTYWAYL